MSSQVVEIRLACKHMTLAVLKVEAPAYVSATAPLLLDPEPEPAILGQRPVVQHSHHWGTAEDNLPVSARSMPQRALYDVRAVRGGGGLCA